MRDPAALRVLPIGDRLSGQPVTPTGNHCVEIGAQRVPYRGGHIRVTGSAGAQVQLTQLRNPVGVGHVAAEPPRPVVGQATGGTGCVEVRIGGQLSQIRGLRRRRGRRPADVVGHAFGQPARCIGRGRRAGGVMEQLVAQHNS